MDLGGDWSECGFATDDTVSGRFGEDDCVSTGLPSITILLCGDWVISRRKHRRPIFRVGFA